MAAVDPPLPSSTAAGPDAAELQAWSARPSAVPSRPTDLHPPPTGYKWTEPARLFWRRQVAITVSHETAGDHLALERTFLAYLRTSLAFAVQGIVIAQLFRLTQSPDAVGAIGYYAFGIPLACVSIGCAILVAFAGAHRFWRQQNAMSRGKVYAGGWELGLVSAIGLLVNVLIFIVVLVLKVSPDDP